LKIVQNHASHVTPFSKELHGTAVLMLHILHKILGVTAAEAFAVLKLPLRVETMSRTQVAGIQSSRVE
jgi:hypothetical protein